jgi:hypothetical protein
MFNIRQVFAILRGYNEAGLFTDIISNGVYISRYTAGYDPIKPMYVRDGPFLEDM